MVQQVGRTINNHHAFKGQITGDMLCRKLIRRKESKRGDWPSRYPNSTGLWTLRIRRNCIQLTTHYISHSHPTNKFCPFESLYVTENPGPASDTTVDRSIPVFHVELLRSPKLLDIRKRIAMFEGSQAPPACPSDKSNINMKMIMEHWWNDTDRGRKTCTSVTLSIINRILTGPGSKPALSLHYVGCW